MLLNLNKMAVSKQEFDNWIKEGKERGATHMISVYDSFDYDDYPVYVMPMDDLFEKRKRYDNVNMQMINEIVEL